MPGLANKPKFDRAWMTSIELRGVDAASRTITAYASTLSMDRHGTVIEPKAFKKALRGYMANPVVLGGHEHWYSDGEPPVIGRVLKAEIDEKGLLVTIQFADDGKAALWWKRYSEGYMKALSIGFRGVATERRPREDGSGEYMVFTEVELLEVSCVAVPSNRDSLVTKALGGDMEALDECRDGTIEFRDLPSSGTPDTELAARLAKAERGVAALLERIEQLEAAAARQATRLQDQRRSLDTLLTAGTPNTNAAPSATPKNEARATGAGALGGF